MPFLASSKPDSTFITLFTANDPVGGMDHSLPINPDQGSSKPMEYWEEQLHKRKPGKRKPQPPPEKPLDPSHQIDDYA